MSNDFEKDLLNLIDNSVYVKTMENLKNRIEVRLSTNSKDNQELVSKPIFVSKNISNKCFIAVHIIKEVLPLNKLTYVDVIV